MTQASRMEALLGRMEAAVGRLEALGLMGMNQSPTVPSDPAAVEAAEKYIRLRRHEMGLPPLDEEGFTEEGSRF